MMWRKFKLAIVAGTILILALLAAGTTLLLSNAERTARQAARAGLERSAQAVETAFNRQVLQVDGALASLPALFAGLAPGGAITPDAATQLLRGLNFQTLAFRDLYLVGADGVIWAATRRRGAGRPLPFGMAEFNQTRTIGSSAVFGPVRNQVTGDWSLYVGRLIELPPAGETKAGEVLAVAEVPLPVLTRGLAETGLQPGLRVALQRRGGQLIASLPHDEVGMGRVQAVRFDGLRADGRAFVLPETGGPDAAFAVVRPTLYGNIFVGLTIPRDVAMADGRRDRVRLLATTGAGAVLIVAFAVALLVALRGRERLDAERTRASTVLTNAIEAMSDGFVMWDENDRLVTWNRRYCDLYAESAPFIVKGALFEDVIRRGAEAGQYPQAEGRIDAFVRETVAWHRACSGTIERQLPGGQWLLITERRTADGCTVGIRTDITALRLALADLAAATRRANEAAEEAMRQNAILSEREGRIRFLAHHDPLTRLPNRVLFRSELDVALRAIQEQSGSVAVLYLDLDRFKDVNDTLGHPAGDELLRLVAERLRACTGHTVVARLGGDEFALICASSDLPTEAEALSRRLIAEMRCPYDVFGHAVVTGASIGIAVATAGDLDGDTLLKQADLALYQAKAAGRGTVCVFAEDMSARLRERLEIEADLRSALANRQLELAYQPIHDLAADALCGYEALLRWHHPVRGSVSPAVFVPIAEETGLIVEIGAWVLRQACADFAMLPGRLRIAVNLSPLQLAGSAIVADVTGVLAETGLDPDRLELEITETALFSKGHGNKACLEGLRALGVRIVLDDFGTGYSSLSHLHHFPLDKIKIDRSFVQDMPERENSAAIVKALAGLATELGMCTTAEGVETAQQLALVREAGCTQVQGYLFGRPQPILRVVEAVAAASGPRRPETDLRALG
ncbi:MULTISPECIES: bifunctional diguanylate cyclase/phosphodiesterase [Methylobacterium]|uniref:bifunctional diguanylate cyclase/phosphodiesterase n=1 Tax=Methylobacterium TaxID=407 RepID=UPI0013EAF90C|nr:EAL domain-containing protein [Methylobacterium sp. DB0501]NGM37071.1 EAL domain-containing protein [Methylobacterium sp. DB0501]